MEMKSTTHSRNSKVVKIIKLLWKFKRAKASDQEYIFYNICDAFTDMGGVYVKFMQGNLLELMRTKKWTRYTNYKVYEAMPADQVDVLQTLRDELGPKISELTHINISPFAAGSFGQVYNAKHIDGTDVVVKILRPTIKTLKKDMRNLRLLGHALGKAFTSWDVDVGAISKAFIDTTNKETDYVTEVNNAVLMYNQYLGDRLIVIPKTYTNLCTSKVIVQQLVGGISGTTLLEKCDQKISPSTYVKEQNGSDLEYILRSYIIKANYDVINGRHIHGDFHPGNIRILPGNKLAFIDFGILTSFALRPNAMYLLGRQYWLAEGLKKPNISALFASIVRFYSPKIFHALRVLYEHKTDQTFLPVFEDFLQKNMAYKITKEEIDSAVQNIDLGNLLAERMNKDNRLGLKATVKDISWNRNWIQLAAFVTKLGYRELYSGAYADLYNNSTEYFPEMKVEEYYSMSILEAHEIVLEWLTKLAQNDMLLFQKFRSELQL